MLQAVAIFATAIEYGWEEKASIDRLKNTLSFHPHIKVFKQREEKETKEPVPAVSGA